MKTNMCLLLTISLLLALSLNAPTIGAFQSPVGIIGEAASSWDYPKRPGNPMRGNTTVHEICATRQRRIDFVLPVFSEPQEAYLDIVGPMMDGKPYYRVVGITQGWHTPTGTLEEQQVYWSPVFPIITYTIVVSPYVRALVSHESLSTYTLLFGHGFGVDARFIRVWKCSGIYLPVVVRGF